MDSGPSSPPPTLSDPLDAFPQRSLEAGDITVLVLYFFFVLAVGLWVSQAGERGGEHSPSGPAVTRTSAVQTVNAVLGACTDVTSWSRHRAV